MTRYYKFNHNNLIVQKIPAKNEVVGKQLSTSLYLTKAWVEYFPIADAVIHMQKLEYHKT